MKKIIIPFLIAFFITSCAYSQNLKTLEQLKTNMVCIKYERGIEWKQISEKFGSPDISPLPEPGTGLGRNIRAYKNKIIIFYTELEEFKEGEKIRFHEIITGIEVCREK
jgi:hypothetical protein